MITIKSPEEIKIMREGGQILKRILQKLALNLAAGKTTQEIDDYVGELIGKEKVTAAFKGYKGFPANTCISINEEVVHGIPSQRVILCGDIVSLDLGICYKGFYTDSCITVGIDKISSLNEKLIRVTEESLYRGIKKAHPGNRLGDVSFAIQSYVEENGFSVVRHFVGHGIGRHLQEEPEVPNFGKQHEGVMLKSGMVLAIEPMVNTGSWEVKTLEDNWTVVTKDGKYSAHLEHTVAITANGPEVLTR